MINIQLPILVVSGVTAILYSVHRRKTPLTLVAFGVALYLTYSDILFSFSRRPGLGGFVSTELLALCAIVPWGYVVYESWLELCGLWN